LTRNEIAPRISYSRFSDDVDVAVDADDVDDEDEDEDGDDDDDVRNPIGAVPSWMM
jgi:hypothetical protein